jgi:hypothetical protein
MRNGMRQPQLARVSASNTVVTIAGGTGRAQGRQAAGHVGEGTEQASAVRGACSTMNVMALC